MGQANSSRERHKSGDIQPCSPGKDGQAFVFDKKPSKLLYQTSGDDDDYLNAKGFEISGTPGNIDYNHSALNPSQEDNFGVEESSPKVLPTVFKWDGGGKQVYITGTFSNWKTIPMVKSHGDFVTIVDLPEGEHQYKFLVDGEWMHDPTEPVTDNGIGSKNNIISVKKSDFEVFDALDIDSSTVSGSQGSEDYGQEVPIPRPQEKLAPPILPPHLLQVILNKDTPLSCEPTLLPEPNHVMLCHLYALSIKDGVMVLSATHRYRKKYVTTLLYKPI
ncbi:5'-AMP-activated protein kinase subunit beta-1 isoform X1 [Daphnia magna]|uniref:Uncharacterized protein n=2 Tax=Daphnia magna TaxID=35525 RepID=A0ABQ9YUN8_9CRUS|nr:5'-AMP-activated protein kinase subunit beta-1 isoform X1 [Daphnia magna]XP_032790165.1 5'-AMP-activated protein kinase subunit beta-1 isoform X1 [Daphnia magna]KAK4004371.1 hypothetical protein OUZ56_006107 [Daphnia magna]KZS22062.1 5'-AMP-activated protein kinase subunit beta-1 [Daphnia magna]